jgi:hypothetical protein
VTQRRYLRTVYCSLFVDHWKSCKFLHPEPRSVKPDELAAFLSEAAIKFLTHC